MCGILVVINSGYSKEKLDDSLSLMKHRGPDFISSEIIDKNYFGHTRLSILDLNERSNQPLHKDNYVISFNGEIYNYKELIKEHHLNTITSSDTEVIVEMYKKYGDQCLKYFNGMFSFCIYDKNNKNLFIARDRLGIKPLYYKKTKEGTIFSSEIAPILNLSDDEFDEFGIRQYKKLRMTIKNNTIYKI